MALGQDWRVTDEMHHTIQSFTCSMYCLIIGDLKIIGDLENTSQINIIILNTKKTIFQSKCDGSLPTILQIKHNVKQCYLHDRYKSIIHNK